MQRSSWKLTLGCVAALAAVVVSVQAATPVASKNIVGYVKVDLVGGVYSLLNNPFNQVDGTAATVVKVLGTQVPNNTSVFVFNGTDYDQSTKLPFGWTDAALELAPGTGWWVQTPSDVTVLLLGEVEDADTVAKDLPAGFSLNGLPYPVDAAVTGSGLAGAPNNTSLYFWNGTDYEQATKLPFGWTADPTIGLEEGFWVDAAAAFTWTETKPY